MKPWDDDERPRIRHRIEYAIIGALVAMSVLVGLASFLPR